MITKSTSIDVIAAVGTRIRGAAVLVTIAISITRLIVAVNSPRETNDHTASPDSA